MISENFIQNLISCKKIAIKADHRKSISKNRSLRNNVYLKSEDEKYDFKLFIRQSEEFIEDFSIGLIWANPNAVTTINRSIILIRFQGPHDGKQSFEYDIHHSFHTHTISIDDIYNKRFISPSNREITNSFHSFNEALDYCIYKCSIIELESVIPLKKHPKQIEGQTTLF